MFFRKYVLRWQAVAIIIGMLAIIFSSVKFYRMVNQEPETNVTYGMPKYKDTAELEVNVLPGKPPPKPEAAYKENHHVRQNWSNTRRFLRLVQRVTPVVQ